MKTEVTTYTVTNRYDEEYEVKATGYHFDGKVLFFYLNGKTEAMFYTPVDFIKEDK